MTMTTKEKKSIYADMSATLNYESDSYDNDIDGYLERQIQTYKHLQDTLSVLEGAIDVLDVVTKKINNN